MGSVEIKLEQTILDQACHVADDMDFKDVGAYLRFCVVSDVQNRTAPKSPPDPKYLRRK